MFGTKFKYEMGEGKCILTVAHLEPNDVYTYQVRDIYEAMLFLSVWERTSFVSHPNNVWRELFLPV